MPTDDYVTRREYDQLAKRVDDIDKNGPRGMDVLALQVGQTADQLGQLRQTVETRFDTLARQRASDERDKRGRSRWRVTAWIGGLAAVAAVVSALVAVSVQLSHLHR